VKGENMSQLSKSGKLISLARLNFRCNCFVLWHSFPEVHCIHFIWCIISPNMFFSSPSPAIFAFGLLLGRTVCSPTTHVPGWKVAIKTNHRHNATICSPQFLALHGAIGELVVLLTGLNSVSRGPCLKQISNNQYTYSVTVSTSINFELQTAIQQR